jgi:tetratricopeptide (TPR) repeat protein
MSRLTSQQDSGTLLYMAPEQLDGESTAATDIYSLGIVFYEMLAGDPPFTTGEITAQIRYKAPREIEGLSPDLRNIVFKCLEKKPENRFADVRGLREQLEGHGARQAEGEKKQEATTGAGQGAAEKKAQEQADRAARCEALKNQAQQASDAGQFGQAIVILQEALALAPEDTSLKQTLSAAQEKAEAVKRQFEWKQWAENVLTQANELLRLGKLREAESLLTQGLQHDHENTDFPGLLAKVRQHLMQRQEQQTAIKKKPVLSKRARIIVASVILVCMAVFGLVAYIIEEDPFNWNGSGSKTWNPPPGTDNGGKSYEPPPPPPPPPQPEVAGDWNYTVSGAGRSIVGQFRISGTRANLQLVSVADYQLLMQDGLWHPVREQNTFIGSVNSNNVLSGQCFNAVYWVNGVQMPAPVPLYLNLTVAEDGNSMSGTGSGPNGTFNIVAHRQ